MHRSSARKPVTHMLQEPIKGPGLVPMPVTVREARIRTRKLMAVCEQVYQSGRAMLCCCNKTNKQKSLSISIALITAGTLLCELHKGHSL